MQLLMNVIDDPQTYSCELRVIIGYFVAINNALLIEVSKRLLNLSCSSKSLNIDHAEG